MRGFDPSCAAGARDLFRKWAETAPEREALLSPECRMTYAELEERATVLTRTLVSSGVRGGDTVGVLMERPHLLPVAVLAVWGAGGAYVPLPASQPRERNELVLTDTGVQMVVADRDPAEVLPGRALRHVRADQAAPDPEPCPRTGAGRDGAASNARSRDLAYVLYTSGSTGVPKGVLVEHGGVTNLAEGLRLLFGDLEGARVLQFAPFTFDAWVWEFAMSLLNGGTLCVPPAGVPLYGPDLSRVLCDLDISHLSGAPSLLATLPVEVPIPVTTLTSGGEPLPEFLVERWAPRLRLFNAYGPTEATVSATAGRCLPGAGKPTIGRPMSGVEVHILDPADEPVAEGGIGEICVGGRGVGRGYLNRPDLTRERFVPDRFSGRTGARLYRTGDLARRLPRGEIAFVGRVDDQLNIRGFRIEPGEVEAALARHPRITGAAVTTTDGSSGTAKLAAYVQLSKGPETPVSELRDFLAGLLPPYMIPSVFVTLDRLPLTSHGKVDRAALPCPGSGRPRTAHGYTPPSNPGEREVAELVGQVLGLDGIGAEDDFFELGGTSADLVTLQVRARERWGVLLPLTDLVAAHNVRLLAKRLDGDGTVGERPPATAANRGHLLAGSRSLKERLGKGAQGWNQ